MNGKVVDFNHRLTIFPVLLRLANYMVHCSPSFSSHTQEPNEDNSNNDTMCVEHTETLAQYQSTFVIRVFVSGKRESKFESKQLDHNLLNMVTGRHIAERQCASFSRSNQFELHCFEGLGTATEFLSIRHRIDYYAKLAIQCNRRTPSRNVCLYV